MKIVFILNILTIIACIVALYYGYKNCKQTKEIIKKFKC